MKNQPRKFKRVPPEISVDQLTPLNITCGSTKCEENLHSFSLKKSALKNFNKIGVCVNCGNEMIDWERIHKKDIKDAEFLFSALKNELIRYVTWNTEISEEAIERVTKLKLGELKDHIKKILKQRIKTKTLWDGRQTPKGGTEITNYGQHATGTCCRQCLEVWHGIPDTTVLSDEEFDYCSELILLFIKKKLPAFYKQLK